MAESKSGNSGKVESTQDITRTLDGIEERLGAVRTKADTNNRPEMKNQTETLLGRVRQLRDQVKQPGTTDFQGIQRNVTEILESTNVLERDAGTSPR